jgi:two-component system, LytTR family, sensor kinase
LNKKLYRAAFISTPILALIGITPAYVMDKVKIYSFLLTWLVLSGIILVFWGLNIAIIKKVKNINSPQRYFLSYACVLLVQTFNIWVIKSLDFTPPDDRLILPYIAAVAINTLILILSNSIILQFQKETAEIEIQQLKVINLEAQKQMLLQQLQPHFLFNALSTLKSLISENPASAEDYTVRLSDFLRYSVQAKKNEVVSLAEELKFTQDYFDLQNVRFGDALQYSIEIPQGQLEKKVPVYALQTLVENAIKHNSFTEKQPVTIVISVIGDRIKVANNRLPKTLYLPLGTGLENLHQRYKMIADTGIEIEQTEANFTVFISLL